MRFLGDFRLGQTVNFMWSTNGQDGASITRATNGTIRVYKDASLTETTLGVSDVEDFDTLTGIHHCSLDTTGVFYTAGADYTVVLAGAVIDTKAVNAVLAQFSVLNRSVSESAILADATSLTDIFDTADTVEPGLTFRQFCRLVGAMLAGKVSGGGTGSELFRAAVSDDKTRATVAADAAGNRSGVTTDLT